MERFEGGKISVVVPVYNTEAALSACVESLLGQTYRNLELLFVDDGSTDGSAALLEAYAKRDDRIRVIDPPGPIRFHALLSRCRLVLTDSGGIQEEVTSLGIPTVVMRYSTERAEGLHAGCLMLAGTHEDGIVCAVNALLRPNSELYEQMSHPSDVFGDGKASERIAEVLAKA